MDFIHSALIPEPSQANQIREILRSYSQPPDHLESTISALSREIARYDTEISRVRAQLVRLEAERATLSTHYFACRGLLSPIRRLPCETLVEIFEICAVSAFGVEDTPVLDVEMARLAQQPLLTASQVCSRWHDIVMGTPTLWNTIELDSVLWTAPNANPDKMMSLLRTILDRGGNTLLKVSVFMVNAAPYGPALELLAAHSERWQAANFATSSPDRNGLRHLSAVKGKLPHLESLSLSGFPLPMDMFEVAPCLEHMVFLGAPNAVLELPKLPLDQLLTFSCAEFWGFGEMMGIGTSPTLSLMPRLGTDANFTLQLSRCDPSETFVTSAPIPPITSHLVSLMINVADCFSPRNIGPVLAAIVDSLTLPGLQDLSMNSDEYPRLPLPWPHAPFLGLAARSSFDVNLMSLELHHSLITEAELLECLRALPALERLAVSDHQLVGGITRRLISDSLFAALSPLDAFPVPRLCVFECRSLLKFDDMVLLRFLLSRLRLRERTSKGDNEEDDEGPFELHITWLPGHERELDPRFAADIEEPQEMGDLVFVFEALEE